MSQVPEERLPKDFGKYRLVKRIATGGMAEIFLAHEKRHPDVPVVIKRILPHLAESSEFLSMFLDEARIAARLDHPNIVAIKDLGQIEGSYYISMEYVHGEDIRRIYNRAFKLQRSLPLSHSIRVIAESARGLSYAHRLPDLTGKPLGVVHRDVSPQNILVTYEGRVKVVDFGIAKAANKVSQTRAGVLKGKYSYMSPEQAMGEGIDHRTDIFALGIILYETTTGTRLFKRQSELATLQAVIKAEVTPPSEALYGYPPELEEIVLRSLAKDVRDRYQDGQDLADDLYEFLHSSGLYVEEVHIAEFMHDLFAERLGEESSTGVPALPKEEEVKEELVGEPTRSVRSSELIDVNTANEDDAVAPPEASGSRSRPRSADPRGTDGDPRGRPTVPAKPEATSADRPAPSVPSVRAVRPPGFADAGFVDGSERTRGTAGTMSEDVLDDLERIARRVFDQTDDDGPEERDRLLDTADGSPFENPQFPSGAFSDTVSPESPRRASNASDPILPDEDAEIPATISPPATVASRADELPTEFAQPVYQPPAKDKPVSKQKSSPKVQVHDERDEDPPKPSPKEKPRKSAHDPTDQIRAGRPRAKSAPPPETPKASNRLVIVLAAALAIALAALVTVLLQSKTASTPPIPPEPTVSKSGEVTVTTEPGASIFIGEKVVGTANASGVFGPFSTPAGKFELKVALPSEGFERTRSLEVAEGRAYEVEIPARKGWIKLAVAPWARVKVDGREVGVTPLPNIQLNEGTHHVILTNPDLGKKQDVMVKVEPNGTFELKVDLNTSGEKL